MLRDRGKRILRRLAGAAVLLAATGWLYAGMGSAASADEFLLQDASGNPLRNTTVQISSSKSPTGERTTTDVFGHIFVPYSGSFELYQVRVMPDGNGNAAEMFGTLMVDGQRGVEAVQLK